MFPSKEGKAQRVLPSCFCKGRLFKAYPTGPHYTNAATAMQFYRGPIHFSKKLETYPEVDILSFILCQEFLDFIFELKRTFKHLRPPAHFPGSFHILRGIISVKIGHSTVTVTILDCLVNCRIGFYHAFLI